MQFNSHANKLDIVSEIDSLCDSDSTAYPIEAKTRRVNAGLEELVGKIVNADGNWQYDDTNYTDAPRGTGNLIEGQEAYTFASEYLEIEQIDVLDVQGYWRRLKQLDPQELGGMSPEQYFGSTSSTAKKGLPLYYDIQGDSVRLYPAPTSTAVTLTSGLRVMFKRTAQLFATTDTTKEPGLPSPYHILLAYHAAIPYCMAYKKDRVVLYQQKWIDGSAEVVKFFGRRNKDGNRNLKNKQTPYR